MVVAISKPALNIVSPHASSNHHEESIMVRYYHRLPVRDFNQFRNRISTQEQIMRCCILLLADGSLTWLSVTMVVSTTCASWGDGLEHISPENVANKPSS